MKRILSTIMTAALVLSLGTVVFAADVAKIAINGNEVPYTEESGSPFVDNASRTQVPFRKTMEAFGAEVSWDAVNNTAVARKDGVEVTVPIGASYIYKDGVQVSNDTAALIQDNRTYLPIRVVLEAFGATVTWNQDTGTVIIKTNAGAIITSNDIQVHFIDCGQGDAILIDSGEFEILIDGGPKSAADTVVNYIKPYVQGDLEVVVATHEHEDHIGGLPAVFSAYTVGKVIDNGRTATTNIYNQYAAAVSTEGCVHEIAHDLSIDLGNGVVFKVMKMDGSYSDPNNNSVISMLNYNDIEILFMGDAEQKVESENINKFHDTDVLKAGHHGSRTASSADFLARTKPETVIISCATNNKYKHPHLATLQRFFVIGAEVYGTSKSGNIILKTNGSTYQLNTSTQLTASDAGDDKLVETKNDSPSKSTGTTTTNTTTNGVTKMEAAYVGNSNTKKFHKLSCHYANKISANHVIYFKNKDAATGAGYVGCKSCNP